MASRDCLTRPMPALQDDISFEQLSTFGTRSPEIIRPTEDSGYWDDQPDAAQTVNNTSTLREKTNQLILDLLKSTKKLSDITVEIRTTMAVRRKKTTAAQSGHLFAPAPLRITFVGPKNAVLLRLTQTAGMNDSEAAHWQGLFAQGPGIDPGQYFEIEGIKSLFDEVMVHYNNICSEHHWTHPVFFEDDAPNNIHMYGERIQINLNRMLRFSALTEKIKKMEAAGEAPNEIFEFERFRLMQSFITAPCSIPVFRNIRASHQAYNPDMCFIDFYDWYNDSLNHFKLDKDGHAILMKEQSHVRIEKAVMNWGATSRLKAQKVSESLQAYIGKNFALHPLHQPIAIDLVHKFMESMSRIKNKQLT